MMVYITNAYVESTDAGHRFYSSRLLSPEEALAIVPSWTGRHRLHYLQIVRLKSIWSLAGRSTSRLAQVIG